MIVMSRHCRGFTLLEMMMVMLLIGIISRVIVSTLPDPEETSPLTPLLLSARWAAEQAQIEGRIYRLHIDAQRWHLSSLTTGAPGDTGPLPGTVWQQVPHMPVIVPKLSGKLYVQEGEATLWFMPDGEMTPAEIEYHPPHGARQRLKLNAMALVDAP